jgi:hypothetical protein
LQNEGIWSWPFFGPTVDLRFRRALRALLHRKLWILRIVSECIFPKLVHQSPTERDNLRGDPDLTRRIRRTGSCQRGPVLQSNVLSAATRRPFPSISNCTLTPVTTTRSRLSSPPLEAHVARAGIASQLLGDQSPTERDNLRGDPDLTRRMISSFRSDPATFPLDKQLYFDASHDNQIASILTATGIASQLLGDQSPTERDNLRGDPDLTRRIRRTGSRGN